MIRDRKPGVFCYPCDGSLGELTKTDACNGYWSDRIQTRKMWWHPVEWSWMWNREIPGILDRWEDFTIYLQEGKWK